MSKHSRYTFWQIVGDFAEDAITDNIVLAQAVGICPIIAAGVSLKNGVALTVCTAVIMLALSAVITFVGEKMPKWLRPAVYAVLASALLVLTAFILERYISPELYARLYLFIPLMAVNTVFTRHVGKTGIISPAENAVHALGGTVGFGVVICLISALREIAISSTLWDRPLGYTLTLPDAASPFAAFILLGFLSALLQWSRRRISDYFRRKEENDA